MAFKRVLERRDYRKILSPEIFNLEYIDRIVTGLLEGIEIRGKDFSDLTAIVLCSLPGWYGADR